MKLLAHRGYSEKYPENTMVAFIKAYERGFDGVETDVHMCKDGELVLIHDEKINRTSDGKGLVADYTLQELKSFNFAYKFDGCYEIPTLRELLEFIRGKDFKVNIELKTDVIHYDGIEEKVFGLVKELGVESQVYYSSFYLPSVLKMKSLDPNAYVGYLMEYSYNKKYNELLDNDIEAFHPKYVFLDEKRVRVLKEHHKLIATWTVPHFKAYKKMACLGVDIVIANGYLREG